MIRNFLPPPRSGAGLFPALGLNLVLLASLSIPVPSALAQNPSVHVLFEPLKEASVQPITAFSLRGNQLADDCHCQSVLPTSQTMIRKPVSENRREVELRVYEVRERIAELTRGDSSGSMMLEELYRALASLHEELGDYDAAIDALSESIQVARSREGLDTLDQLPSLDRMIGIELHRANVREVDDLQDYRLHLQMRNYEADESAPQLARALMDHAHWNVLAFSNGQVLEPENLPTAGILVNAAGSSVSGAALANSLVGGNSLNLIQHANLLVDRRLYLAREGYESILDTVPAATYPELQIEAVSGMLDITLLAKRWFEANSGSESAGSLYSRRSTTSRNAIRDLFRSTYVDDARRLEELIDTLAETHALADPELARLYLDLGDFNLEFGYYKRAHRHYEAARALLVETGMAAEEVEALINPAAALAVPAFSTELHSRQYYHIDNNAQLRYDGVIEVELDINRYGRAKGVKVLGSSEGTPRSVVSALTDHLRGQLFRPHVDAKRLRGVDDIVQRYGYMQ